MLNHAGVDTFYKAVSQSRVGIRVRPMQLLAGQNISANKTLHT